MGWHVVGNYYIVNNYCKPGPSTKPAVCARLLNLYKLTKGSNPLPYGKFYLAGNYQKASAEATAHNWPYEVSQEAWPVLKTEPAPADADHDGMPDTWETAHQLNPNDLPTAPKPVPAATPC